MAQQFEKKLSAFGTLTYKIFFQEAISDTTNFVTKSLTPSLTNKWT